MEDKINLSWRKSSYSGNGGGNCVEVAAHGQILVRDSQDRAGAVLRFPPTAWRRFADRVKRSLALDPALRVSHRSTAVLAFPATGAARTLAPLPCPFVLRERPWCLGRQGGLRGRLEPAVVSSAVQGSPSAFPDLTSSSWRGC
jgi:hypothetical protein